MKAALCTLLASSLIPPLCGAVVVTFADPVESSGLASGTDGSITVNVTVVPVGNGATLNGNAQGVGVDSTEDDGLANNIRQRRVDGSLTTPEALLLTFSGFTGVLGLSAAEIGAFRNGDVVTFTGSVFDGATGYDTAPWSFDDGTDTLSNSDWVAAGVQTVAFDGSEILISSGDTITFSTSAVQVDQGGVLLNSLTLIPEPTVGLLCGLGLLGLSRRRR